MPKLKAIFICQQCGQQAIKWQGRCPTCGAWNALVEDVIEEAPSHTATLVAEAVSPTAMAEVSLDDIVRIQTGIGELDRVLGGGLVPGSVVLVGGEPGIGKSTLLLSMAGRLAEVPRASLTCLQPGQAGLPRPTGSVGLALSRSGTPVADPASGAVPGSVAGVNVLYVSGEESLRQTKLRAMRLGLGESSMQLLAHTSLAAIEETIRKTEARVVVVDSIQVIESDTLSSSPGSISQVRFCAHELTRLAKTNGFVLILVGHITKEGFLAGPKVLEHLVDTVLYFEGEPTSGFRLLRSTKNRFGHTSELGVFHMTAEGLIEVQNPSELFLSDRSEPAAGCMVTVALEGSRPLLVELQALTSPCSMGLPRRRTTGVDFNRVAMLLAVLERRAALGQLAQQDVYVSSLGGVRVGEPACDLAVALAIASSFKERAHARRTVAIGEIGLTGEVRPVLNIAQRLHEAKRVGFERGVVSAAHRSLAVEGLEVIGVGNVREALTQAFD